MIQKKIVLKLVFLIFISLFFFQAAVNNRDKSSSSVSTSTTLNTAQLTEASPIVINSNSDWSGLTSFSWCQGSGTWNDPYIISNITITADMTCISITNSDVYFIIQNSKFIRTFCCGGSAAVNLDNVEKGLIFNNKFYDSPQASGSSIYTTDSFNISILNNKIIHFNVGIDMWDSDSINVTGNIITDCFIGMALRRSDSCYVSYNEIKLTGSYHIEYQEGIRLWSSNSNMIIENNFYCVPNCIVYENDQNYGNTVENNYCHTCNFYNPQEVFDLELLILSLILIGEIIVTLLLLKRLPNRKRRTGIILVGIGLGAMGLLAHTLYNLFALMSPPNYIYQYKLLLYIMGLIGLIAGHTASLVIGIKLIRKNGKRMDTSKKEPNL